MKQSQARDEICRVGASLFARGYVHATAGNISYRLAPEDGGGFLITPTDSCLGNLDPARLALLDDQGVQISGDRGSKTIVLHRKIYQATADAGNAARCVVHTHSTYLVALSLAGSGDAVAPGELLPPLTPYYVMKVGRVPLVAYQRPGAPIVGDQVSELIKRYAARGIALRAVMLDRLGPNAWHGSPAEAMAVLEELEETAKLWMLTGRTAAALSESAISELRQTFGATW